MSVTRLLFVNPFSQEASGPDESLLGLIQRLDKGRFHSTVVLPGPGPYSKKYEEAGAEVIYRAMVRIRRSVNPLYLIHFFFGFWLDAVWFKRQIQERRIALVHTNMETVLSSGLAARWAGVKSVYHVRGTSFARPKMLCDGVVKIIDSCSDRICVISQAVADIFSSRGIREKVRVVYNALDPADFKPHGDPLLLRQKWGVETGQRVVGAFGRVNPRKGLEVFIQAAACVRERAPNVRFLIVGAVADSEEQAYAERLQELSAQLGLDGQLRFVFQRQEAASVLNAFDVLVFTSRDEGFGRVLIEAMALQKPVVAVKVGGVPEIVADRIHGRLIPSHNPQAIAEAIVDIVEHPEEARRMGQNGRRKVEECFHLQNQVETIQNLYEEIFLSEKAPVYSRD